MQAWQYFDADYAIEQARTLDAGDKRGSLVGVPYGVKDIVDTADMPTEYGSPIFKGHRPRRDAACVALSRKAGGVLMGKTVTTEFANVHPGKTRNPWDPQRTPGGSSSGSAAAVAASMVPLAIGTQTTGSTTRPASFCGTFGYRPTWGDLRTNGVMEASGSLDTLGILARSVQDVALYRDVLLGVEPQPVSDIASPPRIGFCRTHVWPRLKAETQKLLEDAAETLARRGARVEDVTLPPDFEGLEDVHRWISGFEMARNLTWEFENHWDEISETFRNGRVKDGLECPVREVRGNAHPHASLPQAHAADPRSTRRAPCGVRGRRSHAGNASGASSVGVYDLDDDARAVNYASGVQGTARSSDRRAARRTTSRRPATLRHRALGLPAANPLSHPQERDALNPLPDRSAPPTPLPQGEGNFVT